MAHGPTATFKGDGVGEPFVWIRNLDEDPHHWLEPRGVPPQGGPIYFRYESMEVNHGAVGITTFRGGDEKNRARVSGKIFHQYSENHVTVH